MSLTIRCKPSVYPYGVHPRVRFMTLVVAQAVHHVAQKDCVITSLVDGVHGSNSYHYLGGAADYRSRHLTPEERVKVLRRVQGELGGEFDFIHETDPPHFHGEWDNNQPGQDSSRMQLQRRMEAAQEDFVEKILDPNEP